MSESKNCCCSTNSQNNNTASHQGASNIFLKLSLIFGLPLYIILLFFPNNTWTFYLYILAYILLGGDVVLEAWKSLWKKDFFNENTLMTIATLGAFFLDQNKEAVGVMLFYKIGELLQYQAVTKSKKDIRALFKLQPNTAFVYRNETWIEEHPKNINVGEIILIKKGDKIPLDGIVTQGESYIDMSSLTGESLPTNVNPESLVYSGTINLGDAIEVKVIKEFKDSSIQKLIQLVEEAGEKKSPTEKFITRFARKYTPIVFFVALLILVVPVLGFGADWHIWLEKSIIFLVISCPCALVLSIPLSFFSGLGIASRQGILIKSGEYLELLTKLKHIAFDKTGTVTHGNLSVVEFIVDKKIPEKECFGYIAITESFSSHPIAVSLQKEYKKRYGSIPSDQRPQIVEIPGKGLKAEIDRKQILVGSIKLMDDHNISFKSLKQPENLGTFVYLAVDNKAAAITVIADTIKETSLLAVEKLKAFGLTVSMFSGDNSKIVEHVARILDIPDYLGELLPEDKVHHIEKLKKSGKTAFVGDGLNDAPSLSIADLGIAMGKKGADISIEAADIVTIDDDLRKIPHAIQIAKKTLFIAKQNIVLALTVKIFVMILTIFGLSNIWEGIFADVGVTLLTVFNATRIIR